jgi:outer membrane protein assembly factor BamB
MRVLAAVGSVLVLAAAACTSGSGGPSASNTPPVTSAPAQSDPVTTSVGSPPAPPAGVADWPMYHGDLARTGVATTMPPVSGDPKVVASLQLDGPVYASPIVVHGTTVVATENNTVYAFDTRFHQLWKQHLGEPSPGSERDCGNIDPLGITGTPVYDATSGLVFVAPEYGGPPRHEVVALRLSGGEIAWHRSIDLPGVETKAMQERGALTVTGGRVWIPFGGLAGDCGGYKGRVVGVNLDGTGDPVVYTVPTTREAGIWTAPGPVVDADGNLFVAVGNGESGTGDRYDYSDSVLKISPSAKLLDSYSPKTWAADNDSDLDLGSQGPALVGGKWVFTAGKSGFAYVLDQKHLGGVGGEVSQLDVCTSFGGTSVSGDVVYVPCDNGVQAVRIDGAGTMHVLWRAEKSIAGSPVIGGGRVWSVDTARTLFALDPATGEVRESVTVGATSRFATPALYGRYVLVGTLSGLTVVSTS